MHGGDKRQGKWNYYSITRGRKSSGCIPNYVRFAYYQSCSINKCKAIILTKREYETLHKCIAICWISQPYCQFGSINKFGSIRYTKCEFEAINKFGTIRYTHHKCCTVLKPKL